jgi:hypothetical protein
MLSAAVILGLSVTLARTQVYGSVPATTNYAIFSGAFGLLASLVGLGAFISASLAGIVTWIFQGLATLFLLIGGILFSIKLRGVKCGSFGSSGSNNLINCGSIIINGQYYTGCEQSKVQSRCHIAVADDVFLFLGCFVSLATIYLTIFGRGRSLGGAYLS